MKGQAQSNDDRTLGTVRPRARIVTNPHRRLILAREPLVGLMLSKQEYESMAGSGAHREPLFPSWTDWNKFQMRAAGTAAKQGVMPEPWTIDVDRFHAWCASVTATPCIDELRNYCNTPGARRFK